MDDFCIYGKKTRSWINFVEQKEQVHFNMKKYFNFLLEMYLKQIYDTEILKISVKYYDGEIHFCNFRTIFYTLYDTKSNFKTSLVQIPEN